MTAELSFPRQQARTQRFSLGVPRAFTVAPDGSRVLFLRSASGTDRRTGLWSLDVETGQETPLFDPFSDNEELSPEERARRERSR
ncbi:MAG TPA: S9 family peptidase, partial [Kutzneria sp.]|nr:S9 family peptidase [Kutzneria sp.]